MDEAPKKGPLTIDRAAFLLLRVKKAFKKKRQQRKDKQAAAQQFTAAIGEYSGNTRGKGKPAPLLRSRTLPAIIVPGISILQAQIDTSRLNTGDIFSSSGFAARLSLQPRSSPRVSLTCDDSPLDYRRKSHEIPHNFSGRNSTAEPYIYAFDDLERHADGTVVLRIPSPHIVAARAYRMSSGNTSILSTGSCGSSGSGGSRSQQQEQNQQQQNTSSQGGTALYRLARLLNQTTKTSTNPIPKDDAPRRLSWERRDPANSRLPRSASIDSMVEAVWSDSPRPSLTVPDSIQQQQSQQLQVNYGNLLGPNRRESVLSPSSGRRTKQHRGMNGECELCSSKKQLEIYKNK